MQFIIFEVAIVDTAVGTQNRGVHIDKCNALGVGSIVRHNGIEETMLLTLGSTIFVKLNREDKDGLIGIIALKSLNQKAIEVEKLGGIEVVAEASEVVVAIESKGLGLVVGKHC